MRYLCNALLFFKSNYLLHITNYRQVTCYVTLLLLKVILHNTLHNITPNTDNKLYTLKHLKLWGIRR